MSAKTKLQITMDEELLNEMDAYCDSHYMNRSWMISQAVLQIVNQQKLIDSISNLSLAMKKAAESGSVNEDLKKQYSDFESLSRLFIGGK